MLYFENLIVVYVGGIFFVLLSLFLLKWAISFLRPSGKEHSFLRGILYLSVGLFGLVICCSTLFTRFYGIEVVGGNELRVGYVWPRGNYLIESQDGLVVTIEKYFPQDPKAQNLRILVEGKNGRTDSGLIPRKRLAEIEAELLEIDFTEVKRMKNERTIYILKKPEP